ncbi:hypothetical protein OH76DRAFT_1486086 [Lentinus brumalis]|uniref:Uncharacterized protein n=1 Tax=Lentinus brumalis TaxID=2498619 RepID=A0A371CZQ6_9APHY|nr:hypothetical protein OH76DRAFT_1486086 [Polyporus brumalis]
MGLLSSSIFSPRATPRVRHSYSKPLRGEDASPPSIVWLLSLPPRASLASTAGSASPVGPSEEVGQVSEDVETDREGSPPLPYDIRLIGTCQEQMSVASRSFLVPTHVSQDELHLVLLYDSDAFDDCPCESLSPTPDLIRIAGLSIRMSVSGFAPSP